MELVIAWLVFGAMASIGILIVNAHKIRQPWVFAVFILMGPLALLWFVACSVARWRKW